MHPYQGARVVAQMEGYGPVSDIILAHHERIDGKGYPRGLKGDEIPALSRIISVADTYDVMTARDSYRTPISSFEAIQELRRVVRRAARRASTSRSSSSILAGKDVRFRHGEDADFDAELGLDKRVDEYSLPVDAAERRRQPSEEAAEPAERDAAAADAQSASAASAPAPAPPARAARCSRTTPVPSSKPASCVSRGTTSTCQWKCSAPRGAVRTQRLSGGGAPSFARSCCRPSCSRRAPPARPSAKLRLVAARHELQLVGHARGERGEQHRVVVDRDDALAAAHLLLEQVAQQAAAHRARVVRGEALALARDQRPARSRARRAARACARATRRRRGPR